jgi:hypothetical protein
MRRAEPSGKGGFQLMRTRTGGHPAGPQHGDGGLDLAVAY